LLKYRHLETRRSIYIEGLEKKPVPDKDYAYRIYKEGSGKRRTGKLNLVVLAGHEDIEGDNNQMVEGTYINRSLKALENVITALVNGGDIPYRYVEHECLHVSCVLFINIVSLAQYFNYLVDRLKQNI
jgi:hypothetical protein